MAQVYIHYCVDPFGITAVLLSGDANKPSGGFMPKLVFNAAINTIKMIPGGKRRYDPSQKIWYIDNEYWQPVQAFFAAGAPAYKLVPYANEDAWEAFLTGSARVKVDWSSAKDNVAAQSFFNNFNSVVERIADDKSDKQTLAELLGLASFEQIPSDKALAKKLYRAAAIKLHPDKNSGDGSKMSTLNELWGQYVNI